MSESEMEGPQPQDPATEHHAKAAEVAAFEQRKRQSEQDQLLQQRQQEHMDAQPIINAFKSGDMFQESGDIPSTIDTKGGFDAVKEYVNSNEENTHIWDVVTGNDGHQRDPIVYVDSCFNVPGKGFVVLSDGRDRAAFFRDEPQLSEGRQTYPPLVDKPQPEPKPAAPVSEQSQPQRRGGILRWFRRSNN